MNFGERDEVSIEPSGFPPACGGTEGGIFGIVERKDRPKTYRQRERGTADNMTI